MTRPALAVAIIVTKSPACTVPPAFVSLRFRLGADPSKYKPGAGAGVAATFVEDSVEMVEVVGSPRRYCTLHRKTSWR